MLAPSTVIDDRHLLYAAPRKFDGPMQMPLPPATSIASLMTCAAALGHVVLGDRGEHRGLLAEVDRARGQHARRVHQVEVAAHARERFLDAFELADRRLELAAHARVAAGRAHDESCAMPVESDGSEIERPAARHSISMRQPLPTIGLPADDPVDRNEHVLARVRAVLEHRVERHVAAPDVDARDGWSGSARR